MGWNEGVTHEKRYVLKGKRVGAEIVHPYTMGALPGGFGGHLTWAPVIPVMFRGEAVFQVTSPLLQGLVTET